MARRAFGRFCLSIKEKHRGPHDASHGGVMRPRIIQWATRDQDAYRTKTLTTCGQRIQEAGVSFGIGRRRPASFGRVERAYRTVTSGANPRKQRPDEFRWANYERTNQTPDVSSTTEITEGHREEVVRCRQASVGSANGTNHAVASNDHPLRKTQLGDLLASAGIARSP
ncbi:hypothetical protein TBK1r_29640 [Stieleria magnilauensis]|uniref:Rhodopirellula transposase n=1 Tax=Stieleria magnilauensis TaxID=2527963 RepID=A0ABX5XRQ7_9BACT|nr:hypothetical protein TBK1r_29640 [Planctomycetes bacterium TBK1r]